MIYRDYIFLRFIAYNIHTTGRRGYFQNPLVQAFQTENTTCDTARDSSLNNNYGSYGACDWSLKLQSYYSRIR